MTGNLTSLVKKIDESTQKHSDCRMGSFVVLLTDDQDKAEGKLKELAEKEKLKKIVLTIDNPAGPKGYEISKDADVTVVLYAKRKVVKTFAFEKGKMTDKDISAVVAGVKEILPKDDK